LARPALISARANSAVLLGITRADNRLVAVGERGIILLSYDNGASWKQVKAPVSTSHTNAHFVSAEKGWVIGHGGVVLRTDDGGETWVKQLDGIEVARLLPAVAKAKSPGSPETVAKAEQFVVQGADKPFFDVHFVDRNTGFMVGAYGLILASDNGG